MVKGQQVPFKNCADCRAKNTAKVSEFNKTEKGKACVHRANTSNKGKKRFKRYDQKDKGKERIQRGRKSEAGQAARARLLKEQRENPGKRLAQSLRDALARIWHQRQENAPILWRNSEFRSTEELMEHLISQIPGGMSVRDARATLQIDHRIPVSAFDHNIPGNSVRCHSKANITLLSATANDEKHKKVIRSECQRAGVACYPIEWGGVIRV